MLTVWSFQQSQWRIASKAQLMLSRVIVHKWESGMRTKLGLCFTVVVGFHYFKIRIH